MASHFFTEKLWEEAGYIRKPRHYMKFHFRKFFKAEFKECILKETKL